MNITSDPGIRTLRVHHCTLNRFDEILCQKSEYRAVADVVFRKELPVLEALDYAFRDTNHINHPWWENFNVRKLILENIRSTSVGDLIEDLSTGEMWMCMYAGWIQVILNTEIK